MDSLDHITNIDSKYYEKLINASNNLIFHCDLEGRYIYVSKACERIYGYTQEEMKGRHFADFMPDYLKRKDLQTFSEIINERKKINKYETTHLDKSGKPVILSFDAEYYSSPEGHYEGVFGVAVELTEFRKVEQELRKERSVNIKVMETCPIGVTLLNASGNITYANKQAEKIFQLSRDVVQSRTYKDQSWAITDFQGVPIDESNLPFSIVKNRLEPCYNIKHAISTEEGERKYLSVNISPLISEQGGFEGAVAAITDISEQYLIECKLKESEEKYRQLFENMSSGFAFHEIILDEEEKPVDYRFIDVNPSFERLTTLKRENILGKTCLEVMPDTEEYWVEKFGDVALTGKKINYENYSSALKKHYEVYAFSPKKGYFAVLFNDCTKRKEMEAEIRQLQKMNAVGQLAGGIAHDFNNMLNVILGSADMACEEVAEGSVMEDRLHNIIVAAERSQKLVEQILTFSHKKELPLQIVNLSELVEDAVKLLKTTIPSSVIIKIESIGNHNLIHADATKVHEVIINLICNSVKAMEEKGNINIKNYPMKVEEKISGYLGELEPGNYIVCEIADDGCGMSGEVKEKIFEPFFTTKNIGEGTGMGLAVVYGILASFKGNVQVESKLTQGSIFRLFFPQSEDNVSTESTIETSDSVSAGRILFVDDEEIIVESSTDLLSSLGFEVTPFSSSPAAWEYFSENPDSFDLLIFDQTMPEINGLDLAKRVFTLRPDIPVILCTGYSNQVNAESAKEAGIRAFCMKPFRRKTIRQIINDVLSMKGS